MARVHKGRAENESTSTDDASGESPKLAQYQKHHSWLDRRMNQAESKRKTHQHGIQRLKQQIQTIIDKQDNWYTQSQEQQYIRHAYEKYGESAATLKASTTALNKMVREHPHDHEFIKVVFEPIPRFGVKRFEKLVELELEKKPVESTRESVVEDFKKVFQEHGPIDHSFGPAEANYPKIILPSAEANNKDNQATQVSPGTKNRLVQQNSNIVSEDLHAGGKRKNLLSVPARGFSLPGSPNTVTEKSGHEMEKIRPNFRSGSKSKIGGSPSSLNSKTAGKSSRDRNSAERSTKKDLPVSSQKAIFATAISISGLQPPCLAPLSKMQNLLAIGASRSSAKQLKISKLTIDPASAQQRKAFRPDALSN